jgi:hypothetical protein
MPSHGMIVSRPGMSSAVSAARIWSGSTERALLIAWASAMIVVNTRAEFSVSGAL